MFIKYDEVELMEFFESEPTCVGEYEAGIMLYSYQCNEFKIVVVISVYERYMKISINYNNNTIYSQRYDNVFEIKQVNSKCLRVHADDEKVIILKKEPQIGVIVE